MSLNVTQCADWREIDKVSSELIVALKKLPLTYSGADPGGGGASWGSGPPPPFGGPPNFIKRVKTLGMCVRIHHVLVLKSYPDPPFQNPVSAPDL